jgi:DNA invertase Pin-like site-specific DNA recombinase
LVLNVLGSVSQWEREAIGERTSAALQHKASQGEFTGGEAPFGFRATEEGKLEPVEAEQRTLTEARVFREQGLSLRAICRALHDRGYVSRVGRPFAPMQVARMVS